MRALNLPPEEVERVVREGIQVDPDEDGRKRFEGDLGKTIIRVVMAVDRPDLVVTVYRRSR